jgi:hypothetical protein
MSAKINRHNFHGFYSNYGYSPSFSLDRLWADYPIHVKRAIFGANDPKSSGGSTGETPEKPPEFEDEESALKWYKKTRYGVKEFEKLNFPEDFCKNYFLIPAIEFHKYRSYFHGMIKSILFKWNYGIEYQGSHEDLDDCECSSSSSSEESSSEEPSSEEPSSPYHPNAQNAQLMLNILKLLEDEELSVLLQETEIKNLETGDEDCCYCPPCDTPEEDRSSYKCSSNFRANFSLDVEIDTKKIFELSDLQTRIGATQISRRFVPSYEDDSKTMDELYSRGTQLYKKNWELNPKWNEEFRSKEKFSENATRINDPIILQGDGFGGYYGGGAGDENISLSFSTTLGGSKGGNTKEIIDNQQQTKQSNNLGNIKFQISSQNAYFTSISVNFFIGVSTICYIKSQNKFMCFVEISSRTDDSKNHYIDGKDPDDYRQIFPIEDSNISPLTIFSTFDLDKKEKKDETYFRCPNGDKTGLKLKKDKLNIKIDNQNAEIEIYTPEKTEFKYKSWKTGLSKTGCENKDLDKNCSTDEYTKKWIINKPSIEFLSWKDDFSKDAVYPPKVS